MNNMWTIVMKYGQYLKYLPLLAGLIDFVRTAQREFSRQGSGAEKAVWAEAKFVELVSMLEGWMWIKPRLADFLRESAGTLVKAIVEWYKDARGEVPPKPPVDGPVEPPPAESTFPYDTVLQFPPLTVNEAHLLTADDRKRFWRRIDTSVGWIVQGPLSDPPDQSIWVRMGV